MQIKIDREHLEKVLCDLVKIDSVNPDLVSGGAGEEEAARFLAGELDKLGLKTHLDELPP